jgi:hypothetical protein
MNNQIDDAATVLARLHDDDEAATELAQINRQINIDRALDNSWLQMIRKPSYRKRSLLGLLLASSSQMIGTLVIASRFNNDLFYMRPSLTFSQTTDQQYTRNLASILICSSSSKPVALPQDSSPARLRSLSSIDSLAIKLWGFSSLDVWPASSSKRLSTPQ